MRMATQPVDVEVQRLVDQPELLVLVEHLPPHQRRDEARQGIREDEQRAPDALALDPVVVEQQRKRHAEQEGREHRDQREDEVPDEDLDEPVAQRLVGQRVGVVAQADILDPSGRQRSAAVLGHPLRVLRAVPLAGRRVDDAVGRGVVAQRCLADEGFRQPGRLDPATLDGHGERRQVLGASVDLAAGEDLVSRGCGDLAGLGLGHPVGEVLEPVGGADRGLAVLIGEQQHQRRGGDIAALGHADRHGVTRGVCDLLDRLGHEVFDRRLLGLHVTVAVIGERGHQGEDDRPDLQREQEDQPGEEVFHRHSPPGGIGREDRQAEEAEQDDHRKVAGGGELAGRPQHEGQGQGDGHPFEDEPRAARGHGILRGAEGGRAGCRGARHTRQVCRAPGSAVSG